MNTQKFSVLMLIALAVVACRAQPGGVTTIPTKIAAPPTSTASPSPAETPDSFEPYVGIWEGEGTGALTFHQMPDVKVHFRVEISKDASGKFIIVVEENGETRTYYQREMSYGLNQWPDDEGWYNFDDGGDPVATVVYVRPVDNDALEIDVSYLAGSSWATLYRVR